MHRRSVLMTLATSMLIGVSAPSASADIIAGFEPPTYAGSTASLGVTFAFAGDPGDALEAFQLSVIGSDPLLTGGGTDYSRFSFTPNASLLSGWDGTPDAFGTDGFVFYSALGGGLAPSATPYQLGTLTVDLSGLIAGTPLLVTLDGRDSLFPTAAAGSIGGSFDFIPVDAGSATARLTAVPEPASLALFGLGLGVTVAAGLRSRRRVTRSGGRT